jgi:hypothetical protein
VKKSVLPAVLSGTTPELFWKVMVLSAVGSVMLKVVSLVSFVAPSKTSADAPWIAAVTVRSSVIALPIAVLPLTVKSAVRVR